jgi:hypothetical protein
MRTPAGGIEQQKRSIFGDNQIEDLSPCCTSTGSRLGQPLATSKPPTACRNFDQRAFDQRALAED